MSFEKIGMRVLDYLTLGKVVTSKFVAPSVFARLATSQAPLWTSEEVRTSQAKRRKVRATYKPRW